MSSESLRDAQVKEPNAGQYLATASRSNPEENHSQILSTMRKWSKVSFFSEKILSESVSQMEMKRVRPNLSSDQSAALLQVHWDSPSGLCGLRSAAYDIEHCELRDIPALIIERYLFRVRKKFGSRSTIETIYKFLTAAFQAVDYSGKRSRSIYSRDLAAMCFIITRFKRFAGFARTKGVDLFVNVVRWIFAK